MYPLFLFCGDVGRNSAGFPVLLQDGTLFNDIFFHIRLLLNILYSFS